MRKLIYSIIVILLIGILLISSIYLYKAYKENKKQEEVFNDIIDIVEEIQIDNKEKQEEINIKELYKQNNDIIGWLKIEDTNINYPVMQTKDRPDYYLRRNFYKEYSYWGTPYIAEQCDIENSGNLIIYGHNISGNKMFGELEKYKKEDYYKEHKIIKFYTKNEIAEYEIISVFKTVINTGFKYYKYYNLKDEKEFNTFINKCIELSLYNTEKTAKYGDKLISLSTCEYSNENGRLVVVAREII